MDTFGNVIPKILTTSQHNFMSTYYTRYGLIKLRSNN
jgi:hypothetical protein